jgi:transposase
MHLDISFTKVRGKVYKRVLLRTSYREGKKVKHKTIANLSDASEETIDAIRIALKNKKEINKFLANVSETHHLKKGPSVGAIYALHILSNQLSITQALGSSLEGRLALWQIIARTIEQGSRLSAVRAADRHAVCDLLNLEPFTEDDLYKNLDWLAENQEKIEQRLFKYKLASGKRLNLFLYDVTSSYAEGEKNEYGAFGYNRDRKRGKKQIVIGLLTDYEGDPVSIQVFDGNMTDNKTFVEQVYKVRDQFGVENVIWVGDRGMIKGPQIKKLGKEFQYVSAVTTPQMLTLLKEKKISFDDFTEELKEVLDEETGIRYILRRNPVRVEEIASQRRSKLDSLEKQNLKANSYLKEHVRAKIDTSARNLRAYAKKLKIDTWVAVRKKGDTVSFKVKEEVLKEISRFDGCYIVKTNVINSQEATSGIMHARYKDLSDVEWAFRTMKTTHLEIRPYYVRKCSRTDGHAFVVMLAYKLVRHLREAWKRIEITVEEGISELAHLHSLLKGDEPTLQHIPRPHGLSEKLFRALNIELPLVLPYKEVHVATRKKLLSER